MQEELQQILGTDKRNPCFTVFRDSAGILVFYGGELLERLPDDRSHLGYKLMVARLYNAGINSRRLQEAFKVDPKTMRCWGRTLEGGDPVELVRVLAGRQATRKLTIEIQSYARMRFSRIYPENRRSYSQAIRAEIVEVFGVALSAESLRSLFGGLRESIFCEIEGVDEEGETPCDGPLPENTGSDGFEPLPQAIYPIEPICDEDPYRKRSPFFRRKQR